MPITAPTTDLRAAPPIQWDEPDCLLCGSRRRSTVLEAQDPNPVGKARWFAVVACHECGLAYTCPRPDEATIGGFYPDGYRPHLAKKQRPTRRPRLAWLSGRPCVERRGLPPHGECRLLDFGCGGGSFLSRMKEQGWSVTGLDSSPAAVETVRRTLGVPALLGSLPHPELTPGSFDVVTMWQVLEHVHRPLTTLRAARQLLAPGGKLLIAVPNIAGLPFAWFRQHWFGLDLPRHLTHFTPVTLDAMLHKAGFAEVTTRQIRHSDWLRSSATMAAGACRATWRQRLLQSRKLAKIVSWGCYVAGRADCVFATATG